MIKKIADATEKPAVDQFIRQSDWKLLLFYKCLRIFSLII